VLNGPRSKLPETVHRLVEDSHDELFVSVVSVWEMAIKTNLGKLDFKGEFGEEFLAELKSYQFQILEVNYRHACEVSRLPILKHRDPFDRLLIAQARVENLTVITNDPNWSHPDYALDVLWK
jgi:PIN domain nuclease of toxin-antitoxin system